MSSRKNSVDGDFFNIFTIRGSHQNRSGDVYLTSLVRSSFLQTLPSIKSKDDHLPVVGDFF